MKKTGSKLKKLALGGMIALGLAGGMKKANAQEYVFNPFVQPNDSTLNWYGSGDVNNDNAVDWNDVSKMENIIDGSYTPNLNSDNPSEYRTLDRADVNGDGVVNQADKNILEDKLNGVRNYLPGEWNRLKGGEERENDWKEKSLFQWNTKLKSIPYIPEVFNCDNFARLNMRDFHGSEDEGYEKTTGWEDNGRFNRPVYYVEFVKEGIGHAVTGTAIGNNIKNFNDWSIREINGLKYGEDINFPENCEIVIKAPYDKNKNDLIDMIKFRVENGNATFTWQNPYVNIVNERDTIPPENELYANGESLEWNVKDDNFKNLKYSLDKGETWTTTKDKQGSVRLSPGKNETIFESEDSFYNKTRTEKNFYVTGLEDKVMNADVKFYPNPVKDIGLFEYQNPEKKEIYLEIYNPAGQLIEKKYSDDKKIEVNFSDYSHGVYLYRILDKNSNETIGSGKVVRE